jgi:TRAP-type mannitol/chloroaromatic compound transport system permease small subunit
MDIALTKLLLPLARRIDQATTSIGRLAAWLVLAACLISMFNSVMRYGAHFAAQLLLDLPPLLFAGIVLGTAPKALKENSHIRVDILFRSLRPRLRAIIDIIGNLLFLIPVCLVMIARGVPAFTSSWRIGEGPATPGGLPPWPAKALIPLAFALLLAQALAELVKSIAAARGLDMCVPRDTGPDPGAAAAALRSSGAP